MRYNTVVFDWGDTLSPLDANNVPILSGWTNTMLKKLYNNCYRLAIISNTHRYQDGHWIRKELAKHNLLQEFEVIISSATYAIHKPDPRIFQKLIDFMQIDPRKAVMVGDSKHCDGAAQFFGMSYLAVEPKERWENRLYELLDESFTSGRKLCNIYEYQSNGNTIFTRLRHLSTELTVGDFLLVGGIERRVVKLSRTITKELVLSGHKEDFVEIELSPIEFSAF